MRNGKRIILIAATLGFLSQPFIAWGRDFTDMDHRTVTIPDRITKVFATSPPGTYLVYAINPEAVAGLNFPLWENEKKYTVPSYRKLPVIGGLVGNGRAINQEVLLQVKPDVAVVWGWKNQAVSQPYAAMFEHLGIPWVSVKLDTLAEYPQALLVMGDLLNQPARAKSLHDYAVQAIARVQKEVGQISAAEKPRVYYAEGVDGLSTEGAASVHAELIPVCGGINVHPKEAATMYGNDPVSLETVMAYNPDVILVKEKIFFDRIYKDERWKDLAAVRSKKVYLIPYVPFNWFDRPPSFMRLLGAQWLLATLHPQQDQIDLVKETRRFYKLFLGVELSEQNAREVLNP
jgi:iron complex transport system substrate-binding protein